MILYIASVSLLTNIGLSISQKMNDVKPDPVLGKGVLVQTTLWGNLILVSRELSLLLFVHLNEN